MAEQRLRNLGEDGAPTRLTAGAHPRYKEGMCVMEYVAWRYNLGFRDLPSCTAYAIAYCAQSINDHLLANTSAPEIAERLAARADRLFEAHPIRDREARDRAYVRVTMWAIRRFIDYRHTGDERKRVFEQHLAEGERLLASNHSRDLKHQWYWAVMGDLIAQDASLSSVSEGIDEYVGRVWIFFSRLSTTTADSMLDWLDGLLDAYDKARAEEGVLSEEWMPEQVGGS